MSRLIYLAANCVTCGQAAWQIAYVEPIIGSIRRKCLDHVIILGERHLKRGLSSYADYYHTVRPHLSLKKDAPDDRGIQRPS